MDKQETEQYILKYGDLFGKLEKQAVEFRADMKRVDEIQDQIDKLEKEQKALREKWDQFSYISSKTNLDEDKFIAQTFKDFMKDLSKE